MRVKELAESWRVSEDTVRNAVKRCGIEVQNGKATELTQAQVNAVVSDLLSNRKVNEQIETEGVSGSASKEVQSSFEAGVEISSKLPVDNLKALMKSQICEIVSSELSDVVKQVVDMTTEEVTRVVAEEVAEKSNRDYVADLQKFCKVLLADKDRKIKKLEMLLADKEERVKELEGMLRVGYDLDPASIPEF